MQESVACGTFNEDGVELSVWKAKGKFTNEKYVRLIQQFGVQPLTDDLLARFQRLTGHRPHHLLRRGLFFAHRQFGELLDDYERGNKIFLYTGRGPTSDALHLGHVVPMQFTCWLQKVFDCFCVFQMADDEKYFFKDMEFHDVYHLGFRNARDVIAMGFNPEKTFVFSNRDQCRNPIYQKVVFDIMKHSRINDIISIFGLGLSGNAGTLIWPIMQTVPAFSEAFADIFDGKSITCLVCYAIDQDPYFRLARDVAPKLGYKKPCSLICQFLPALEGDAKMSSTNSGNAISNTIFMDDTRDMIAKKIKRYAFSGGRESLELHRLHGGNPDVDICYQLLRYFLDDDDQLADIEKKYRSGEMLTSELKAITIRIISDFIDEHQKSKSSVTNDMVKKFYNSDKKY